MVSLQILDSIFEKVQEEAGPAAASLVAQHGAESYTASLAARFDALSLQIATSAQIEIAWACRGVDAVDQALAYVPSSTAVQDDADLSRLSPFVHLAFLLLAIPIWCAAASETALGAALHAVVALAGIAFQVIWHSKTARSSTAAREARARDHLVQRRRLFDLRMTELRRVADEAPQTPEVVLAAHPRRTINLSSSVANLEYTHGDTTTESDSAPPFTMVDELRSLHVARAVPLRQGPSDEVHSLPAVVYPSKAHAKSDVQDETLQVLGEIGTLDQRALAKSFASAMTLVPDKPVNGQRRPATSVRTTTVEILTGATTTPLPEPETQDDAMQRDQTRLRSSMTVTPPARHSTASESLPDVSQADASRISSFSLSPGGTAQNMSCSPAILLDYRNETPSPAIGFRAHGIERQDGVPIIAINPAVRSRPDRPRACC